MSDILKGLRDPNAIYLTVDECVAFMRAAADEIERLRVECEEWRECAQYDPKMEGPVFKGWNRSALDRCRTRFIETKP